MKKIFQDWVLPLPYGVFSYAIWKLFMLFGASCNSVSPPSRHNDPELNSLYLDMWDNGGLSAGYLGGTWWIFLTEGASAYIGASVAFGQIPKFRKQILYSVIITYVAYVTYEITRIPTEFDISFKSWYAVFCYSVFPLAGIIFGALGADKKF